VLLFLMLLLSFLMLSEFRYPSFKTFSWKTRRSLPWVFVMILVLVSAVAWWKVVPFFIFLSYLAYGCVRPYISREWKREIEADDEDDAFEPELVEADSDKDESAA
jgi:CDP-diacylglycerol--serine O-phosphatidyltransferase